MNAFIQRNVLIKKIFCVFKTRNFQTYNFMMLLLSRQPRICNFMDLGSGLVPKNLERKKKRLTHVNGKRNQSKYIIEKNGKAGTCEW